jgi:hypothetical protein
LEITACDSLRQNALAWVETSLDDTLSVMGFSAELSLLSSSLKTATASVAISAEF